jgi:hypothetical protein
MADDVVRNTGRVDELREAVAVLDAKYRGLAGG